MSAEAAPLTVRQATRRFVGLTALRWLPVGITIPVTVLLALSRGLSLADVGLMFLVHSVLVVLLELPTGGLADALGRRPVLVVSGLLHLASCLVYATAHALPAFTAATALLALGRALDSGPLEAWYVDTVHRTDPRADVVPGLSRAGIADCLALALGAIAGGLAPGLLDGPSSSLLVLPYVAACALDVVSVAAVLLLVTPTGPARGGSALRAVGDGVRALPLTVREAVGLSVRDPALRRVLALSAVTGLALSTLELLGPPLFADLRGSREGGSGVFGVVMAVSFVAGASGAALAPSARRLARGSTRSAVAGLSVLSGLAFCGVASARTVALAAAAYAGYYLAGAAGGPLLNAVLHGRVGADRRATVLSAKSLALQAGGALSSLAVPYVVELRSVAAAYLLVGTALLAATVLALRLPPSADEEPLLDEPLHDGQHLLGGLGVGEAGAAGQHGEQVAEPAVPVAPREQRRPVRVDPA